MVFRNRGRGRGQHDFPKLAFPLPPGAFRSRRITPCPRQRMCYEADESSAIVC